MSAAKSALAGPGKTVAENRRARYEYELLEEYEAGLVLYGSEVKSLRSGKSNIADAFADIKNGEIWIRQMHIAEYKGANRFNHDPGRPRKLLLKKSEIRKLIGKVQEKGLTVVPLRLYFNAKNIAKIQIALAKGKKTHDKRETIKQRDWNRNKQRILKGDG